VLVQREMKCGRSPLVSIARVSVGRGFMTPYISFIGGQDDLRIGKFLSDCDPSLQAVHLRHLQVHQGDVRMV